MNVDLNSGKYIFSLIAIALIVVFVANFYIMSLNDSNKFFLGVDALNHIQNYVNQEQDYQPLTIGMLSVLVSPNNTKTFYFLHVFLLFVVIPFLLFKISKHWLSVVIYYSSYFVFLSDNNATLPQTVIVIGLLAMFLVKNNFVRLGIVLFSFGFHSWGWVLLLAWFFILNFKDKENLPLAYFLLPCATPKTGLTFYHAGLKEKLNLPLINLDPATVINLFSRVLFLPLWYFTFKGLFQKENRPWLFLSLLILAAGIFAGIGGNLRILSMLVFPFAIGLTHYYKYCSTFERKVIIFLVVVQFLANLVSWVERKNILYCDLIVNNHLDFSNKTLNGN